VHVQFFERRRQDSSGKLNGKVIAADQLVLSIHRIFRFFGWFGYHFKLIGRRYKHGCFGKCAFDEVGVSIDVGFARLIRDFCHLYSCSDLDSACTLLQLLAASL
jgi:hypothetical protein